MNDYGDIVKTMTDGGVSDDMARVLSKCVFKFSCEVYYDDGNEVSVSNFIRYLRDMRNARKYGLRGFDIIELIDVSREYWSDIEDMIHSIIDSLDGEEERVIDDISSWASGEFVGEDCGGVPGGMTPSCVGGMGEITFPGDGTPGSGDVPSPTGKVYYQVAPFGLFETGKKKRKKRKKFRKKDEPCTYGDNPPVYKYVDDFREYVDRTYNNMDRRK